MDGKSPWFMAIVLAGYACGIAARLADGRPENDWLVWVYLLDMALVSTDLALYFRFRDAGAAPAGTIETRKSGH